MLALPTYLGGYLNSNNSIFGSSFPLTLPHPMFCNEPFFLYLVVLSYYVAFKLKCAFDFQITFSLDHFCVEKLL